MHVVPKISIYIVGSLSPRFTPLPMLHNLSITAIVTVTHRGFLYLILLAFLEFQRFPTQAQVCPACTTFIEPRSTCVMQPSALLPLSSHPSYLLLHNITSPFLLLLPASFCNTTAPFGEIPHLALRPSTHRHGLEPCRENEEGQDQQRSSSRFSSARHEWRMRRCLLTSLSVFLHLSS